MRKDSVLLPPPQLARSQIHSLQNISRLLAEQGPTMFSFMDHYIFSRIKVPRQESLASLPNFIKLIDFCLRTRQRENRTDLAQGKQYFAENFLEIKKNIDDGNWVKTVRLVYAGHGVGQKIGSLILETLIHYGNANKSLEPELFVPIDTHVYRVFTECLGLAKVPPVASRISSPEYLNFQKFLADNTAEGSLRIHFDYLWFVGKVFCSKITEKTTGYSRGFRLCPMCWIKEYCSFPEKWNILP